MTFFFYFILFCHFFISKCFLFVLLDRWIYCTCSFPGQSRRQCRPDYLVSDVSGCFSRPDFPRFVVLMPVSAHAQLMLLRPWKRRGETPAERSVTSTLPENYSAAVSTGLHTKLIIGYFHPALKSDLCSWLFLWDFHWSEKDFIKIIHSFLKNVVVQSHPERGVQRM